MLSDHLRQAKQINGACKISRKYIRPDCNGALSLLIDGYV